MQTTYSIEVAPDPDEMEKTAVPKAMTQQHKNWTLEVFEAYNAAYKFNFKKTITARQDYM